jgi:hypothetical protein
MTALIFDIETGPLPDEDLEQFFEYDETKVTGYHLIGKTFDPASVKCGNLKDPAKIEAKVEEARKKFLDDQEAANVALAMGRDAAWEQFKSKAALSPVTGRVLAVGWHCDQWTEDQHFSTLWQNEHDEKTLVRMTLETIEKFIAGGHKVIGNNICNFDLPFLIRRAWKFGIRIPLAITAELNSYRSTRIIDTLKEWRCGVRDNSDCGKLDYIAKFFGVGEKNGNATDFHRLFFGTPEENKQAIDYLVNDVKLTYEVAKKMNLI